MEFVELVEPITRCKKALVVRWMQAIQRQFQFAGSGLAGCNRTKMAYGWLDDMELG